MQKTENIANFIHTKLEPEKWQGLKNSHEERISELIDGYMARRQEQAKHPVLDFLFEYYAFRPSYLRKWSPGFGVLLKGATRSDTPQLSELIFTDKGAFLNPDLLPDNRNSAIQWILKMLKNSLEKQPSFGCFGMHEWAMVYKQDPDQVRHNHLPLRMNKEELAEFVESRPLVCTHFDAFRFFTEPAKPMNKFKLSREQFAETEQPGCLHTNMDLYKWAFKMYPWISSELIREAFELAVKTRYFDMKASPYDLSSYGLEPIKIETEEGRVEYSRKQIEIFQKSQPIRKKLIEQYTLLSEILKH
ncbi:MAG: 3-methyladenine DNA glycosylase [Balneolaceae bacterium]|nr:3-methyladenine DNA glycosylase [Balneolaceae bacterium]